MSSSAAGKAKFEARQSSNLERKQQLASRARRQRIIMIAAATGLVLLISAIGFALMRDSGKGASPEAAMMLPEVVAAEPLDASIPRDGRVLGNPNATVTLVEWADYQCPFCGAFGREIMPRVIRDYVVTGQVKIDFRDLPFLDSASGYGESDTAAEAAACAGDQGRFWEYHDTVFANQFGKTRAPTRRSASRRWLR